MTSQLYPPHLRIQGPPIVLREAWGFDGWDEVPAPVALKDREALFLHHEGAKPVGHLLGAGVPQAIHAYHKSKGWAGIGYSWVITQAGTIYEGRGLWLQGAHCPGWNRRAWGVQIHIGGDETPSPAALASARRLYDWLCQLTGRKLAQHGHQDGYPTDCPGKALQTWVRAGMPAPAPNNTTNTGGTIMTPTEFWGYPTAAPNGGTAQAVDVLRHAAIHAGEAHVVATAALKAVQDLTTLCQAQAALLEQIKARVIDPGTPLPLIEQTPTPGAEGTDG